MSQRKQRDYIKEAGLEACSLLQDGYITITYWWDNIASEGHWFLKHRSNGNIIHIKAYNTGYVLYKNNIIVKQVHLGF